MSQRSRLVYSRIHLNLQNRTAVNEHLTYFFLNNFLWNLNGGKDEAKAKMIRRHKSPVEAARPHTAIYCGLICLDSYVPGRSRMSTPSRRIRL